MGEGVRIWRERVRGVILRIFEPSNYQLAYIDGHFQHQWLDGVRLRRTGTEWTGSTELRDSTRRDAQVPSS
jgi:hypothetical protein